MQISFDLKKRNRRYRTLEKYFNENVLNGSDFLCKNFEECKYSFSGNFYEGQLHYIGKYYDLKLNNKPFRIVFVGKEYGYNYRHYSLDQRYGKPQMDVRGGAIKKRDLNPHMKGTTSLLRLLFGIPLGFDVDQEFIAAKDSAFHIYDGYALVNYYLCSAVIPGTTKSRPTKQMERNCFKHFHKALTVLEPTIIAVQGKTICNPVSRAFDSIHQISDSLFKAKIGRNESFLCFFSHPSYWGDLNWGKNKPTPYLIKTVRPTVKNILQEFDSTGEIKKAPRKKTADRKRKSIRTVGLLNHDKKVSIKKESLQFAIDDYYKPIRPFTGTGIVISVLKSYPEGLTFKEIAKHMEAIKPDLKVKSFEERAEHVVNKWMIPLGYAIVENGIAKLIQK